MGELSARKKIETILQLGEGQFIEFKYYLKLAKISYNATKEEILRNIKVLADDGLTNAGVLYFAKEPYKYIISSRIRCVHFNDDSRVDILDKKVVDRGIIGNIEFAISYHY